MASNEEEVTVNSAPIRGGKRARSRNWTLHEILILVEAKKHEWEVYEVAEKRDQIETAASKWKKVSEYLTSKGMDRSPDNCRTKWENVLSDYKLIKDYEKRTGAAPYFTLTKAEKKDSKLPIIFEQQVYDLLDTFQGRRPSITPPFVIDTSKDVEMASNNASIPGDREVGSSGKKRKSNAIDGMAKVLREVEDRKYELEKQKMESNEKMHERLVGLQEACREDDRADKEKLVADRARLVDAFVGIAEAWKKISEKL